MVTSLSLTVRSCMRVCSTQRCAASALSSAPGRRRAGSPTLAHVHTCTRAHWCARAGYGSQHATPSSGSYLLRAGETSDLVWQQATNGPVWSGNVALCLNATCAGGSAACAEGHCSIARRLRRCCCRAAAVWGPTQCACVRRGWTSVKSRVHVAGIRI